MHKDTQSIIHTSIAYTTPQWHADTTTLSTLCQKKPYTILYFYPKDNTPWCTTEAKEFSQLHNEFNHLTTQIIWVSKDTHASHCTFIEQNNLTFPLITDTDLILHKTFGAWWEKTMYGKVAQWVIRTTVLLDQEGKIIKTRKNVKAVWHAEKVLAFCLKNTGNSL
jgi:peroxiredoxin Q/BCP